MTDSEIRDWMNMLVDPIKTKQEIIQELLDNAKPDKLSKEDKEICLRALELIRQDWAYGSGSDTLEGGVDL